MLTTRYRGEDKVNLGNIERTSREFVADSHEFLYGDGFPVRGGTRYMIFYTKSKQEKFITRKWEEIFVKNPNKHYTFFQSYVIAKRGLDKREHYIKPSRPVITKAMRKKGIIKRYFVSYILDKESSIFEVSKQDYGKSLVFYKKVFFDWKLEGSKENILLYNIEALKRAENSFPGIQNFLDPLEFYEEELTLLEKLQKKISNLKFTPESTDTSPDIPLLPPPGGGAGSQY